MTSSAECNHNKKNKNTFGFIKKEMDFNEVEEYTRDEHASEIIAISIWHGE